ncbi:hypothetical protein CSC94_10540 [Zhengella mangrovi]|uniref:ATP synthase subunit I n=1 Tax=Zhengella mangrovi TaxID=1982044 RepID=A0A2G1QN66_9HYPH|nr:ATP synthase subunit I [Zhengella mangrovi]PHP66987.1 hypothetical protein CSC94_10540 [Zhengella mangrovi]
MTDLSLHLPLFSPLWFLAGLAGFAAGYLAGLLHFRLLGSVADRLVRGDWQAVPLQLGRMALLVAFLGLTMLAGAHALIAATAGIVLARNRVLARERARG